MAKKKMTLEEKLEEAIVKDVPYEVPENWIWSNIKSINKRVSKCINPSNFNNERFELYSVPSYDYDFPDLLDGNEIKSSKVVVEKDEILLCKINPRINRVWKVGEFSEYRKIASSEWIVINPNGVIFSNYLCYILKSPYFRELLCSNVSGVGGSLTRARPKEVDEYPIPIPPLKEQQRIVDKIGSLFEKLDKAKELIEEAREDFEKRKFSIIYKGIAGDLTKNKSKMKTKNGIRIPDTWEWIEFKKLGKLERGRSKHRPRNDQRLFGGEYPFIQTGDIANSDVYVIKHKQTLSEFGLNQSRLFEKGTLCITIAANIGDVAILTYDCCFPDSVVGFTPNENVDSKYIYYFLTLIKRDLEHFAPATAQKNINLKILGDVEMPIPSLEEQKEIVRILDKILEKEKRVEELNALEEQIELIKKSILSKAFRGQLRTNCEKEESALELLKEILKDK